MMDRHTWLLVIILIAVASCAVRAAAPSFTPMGALPGGSGYSSAEGVSPNGLYVTGTSRDSIGAQAYIWSAGRGMVGLGDLPGGNFSSQGTGVSDNGWATGIGSGTYLPDLSMSYEAFLWKPETGMVSLSQLPGCESLVGIRSEAYGISGDGAAIAGWAGFTIVREAFVWRSGLGVTRLGWLPGVTSGSVAHGISSDGAVIVGVSSSAASSEQAFRWTQQEGMVGLGFLPGGAERHSVAWAASHDGAIIVGQSSIYEHGTHYNKAFRWTAQGGMVDLGILPGGEGSTRAYGISADGSFIYGQSGDNNGFVWTAAQGMRSLTSFLADEWGFDLAGWTKMYIDGVSSDGCVIAGGGIRAGYNWQPWVAELPEPAMLSLLALGGLVVLSKRRR